MSGLKQFYMKNIKIFTIVLVLIAILVGYKCYTKYTSAQEAKKMAEDLKKQQQQQQMEDKKEGYRYGLELSEIARLQFDKPGSVTAGLYDTPLSRADFGTYGVTSEDPLENIIYGDIQNFGGSALEKQRKSKAKDLSEFTAYGGQNEAMF